ncbi:MAG: bifunctional diaminohydroxyphosphoribosylaminopyrimidine deaminase/5-amino-6-(5-phosphoribosylamino)uracil reductase RibD, partial [Clostridia bacterium]|nr:bifunctional diaminohydroxyphosphoribosylaminopyrimidine deaminase/5-amino-6-(5-phosphoribosylamino)uracil reductase RibD [Clostridia bacterium]
MQAFEKQRKYMLRAIELAKKGIGFAAPNPMVGAVIVKDDRIIGEGYHRKCGELHAERNAFASLTESAEGAEIYVTLEPCCHYGRTPPCTEAIIENKISRVFIGSRDPNPLVSGKGAEILREHGIEVTEDFMREECDELNPIFFHYITKKIPYTAIKFAITLDGKIASYTGASKWITGEKAREHVHSLRGYYSSILAGIGTVLADDPMLNCRIENSHQPLRIVADKDMRIPFDSKLCMTAKEFPLLIACCNADSEKKKTLESMGAEVVILPSFYWGASSRAVAPCEGRGSIPVDSQALVPIARQIFRGLLDVGFRNIHTFVHHQSEDFNAGMPTDLAFRLASRQVIMEFLEEKKGDGWWGDPS